MTANHLRTAATVRLPRLPLLSLLGLVWLLFAPVVQAENRVALVIGNASYATAGNVANAVRNSSAVARDLRALGFVTRQEINLDQAAMVESLRTFVRTARLADIALLYYAGHAVTLDGESYLVPVDAHATSLAAARVELIALNSLIEQLGRNGNRNLLLLEAGQANNYVRQLGQRLSSGAVTALRSSLELPTATEGVIVAGAQAPGRLYEDPPNRQLSRWTSALLAALAEKGSTFQNQLAKAATEVARDSGGQQQPWKVSIDAQVLRLNGAPLIAPAGAGSDPAARAWEELRGSSILEEYEAFVASYPKSPLTPVALERLLWLRSLNDSERNQMVNKTRRKRYLERELTRAKAVKAAALADLESSGYRVEPLFAEMRATGDVALRDRPSGNGTWLGLLREGEIRRVEGQVADSNWVMARLTDYEQGQVYAADGRPVPDDGSAQRFGFVSGSNLQMLPEQFVSQWRDGDWQNNLDGLSLFVDSHLDHPLVADAIDLLLQSAFAGEFERSARPEDAGYVGDGLLRPNLDLSGDIPEGVLARGSDGAESAAAVPIEATPSSSTGNNAGPDILSIPELGYSVEVFEQEYVTTTRANLRRLPWLETRKIATLPTDSRILVTGKVREVNWLRVRYGDGRDVYIFGELAEPYAGSALEAWEEVQKTKDPADLQSYLLRFPQGPHAEQVRALFQSQREAGAPILGDLVAPGLAPKPASEALRGRLINVFPVKYDTRELRRATHGLVARLGRATGAQVLTNDRSSVPGMLMVLVDVVELRTDRLARGNRLVADPANDSAEEELDGAAGTGDRAATHTTSVRVRVNIVDSASGELRNAEGRDNSPIAAIRPSDREVELGIDRAITQAAEKLVPELLAQY